MTWNYATIIEKVKDMAETRGLQLVSRKPTHPGEVFPGGTRKSSTDTALSTMSSLRRARLSTSGGSAFEAPSQKSASVCLSANVLIMMSV